MNVLAMDASEFAKVHERALTRAITLSHKDLEELGRGNETRTKTSESGRPNPDADPGFMARMNVLLERVGGPANLARKSGLSTRVIAKYRDGDSDPNRARLVSLAVAAGVSLVWLATGAGEMTAPAIDEHDSADYVAVPRYDIQAAAGSGAVVVSDNVSDLIYFRRDWLREELGVNPRSLAIITAVGDSMAPTIEDGDLLIVDVREQKWTRDGIYVIGVEDELWVKRVDRLPDGGLVLSSDNPKHSHGTATITRAHIATVRFVGRVAWTGGRV